MINIISNRLKYALTLLFILCIPLIPYSQSDIKLNADQLIIQSNKNFNIGKNDDGKRLLREAMKIAPDYYKPHWELALYYFKKQYFKLSSEQLYLALKKYDTEHGPYFFSKQRKNILLYLGESELNLDRYDNALKAFVEIRKFDPFDVNIIWVEAWIYYKQNKLFRSRILIENCLDINKNAGVCRNISGMLYAREKKYDKAIQEYKNAKFADKDVINHNLGEVYKSIFNYEEAISYFTKVTYSSNNRNSVLSYLLLADIYINSLELDKAMEVLKLYQKNGLEAINNGKSFYIEDMGFINLYLARIHYYLGNLNEAMNHLKIAFRYPQFYGSIVYNKNHYYHLIYFMMSLVSKGLANFQDEKITINLFKRFSNKINKLSLKTQAWWYMRRASDIAINQLNQLSGIYIYESESIFDYTNLIDMLSLFESRVVKKHLYQFLQGRAGQRDIRDHAKAFYYLYLAQVHYNENNFQDSLKLLNYCLEHFNTYEKTLKLRAYNLMRKIYHANQDLNNEIKIIYKIFMLHPPYLLLNGFSLPAILGKIHFKDIPDKRGFENMDYTLKKYLSQKRFNFLFDDFPTSQVKKIDQNIKYKIQPRLTKDDDNYILSLSIIDTTTDKILYSEKNYILRSHQEEDLIRLINRFSKKVFSSIS